ncbi:MAG: hypothetical protein ACI9IL_000821 [Rickettsiales bacterium]|jgi:hypothetical protein
MNFGTAYNVYPKTKIDIIPRQVTIITYFKMIIKVENKNPRNKLELIFTTMMFFI